MMWLKLPDRGDFWKKKLLNDDKPEVKPKKQKEQDTRDVIIGFLGLPFLLGFWVTAIIMFYCVCYKLVVWIWNLSS